MRPKNIWITRKYNLGNYQTVDYHVEASLDENEDPAHALGRLEQIITDYWEGRIRNLVKMAKQET